MTLEKITIEDNVVETGTALAQCCVAGHTCQLGVIITESESSFHSFGAALKKTFCLRTVRV